MNTPEHHEAEAAKALAMARDHHASQCGRSFAAGVRCEGYAEAGRARKALAKAHTELAELTRRVERYRADAIEFHRLIVESETLAATKGSDWECLSDAALLDPDDQPRKSVAFLADEGLIERHPTREGVFRVLDEPRGGGA